MPTHDTDRNWSRLLDEAVRLRTTDVRACVAQLRVLTDVDFPFAPRALQYLGAVLFDVGRYEEAERIFTQLVQGWTEDTSFRRENLCYAAQLSLVLGQYDTASQYITQAKRIADAAFDIVSFGRLRQLEAIISGKQGQSDKALSEMISGRNMVEAHRSFQDVTGQTLRIPPTPVGV